jgi:hypothetical protein
MDVCVATCSLNDIIFLDTLLRSMEMFADLASCNLLVSHNSPMPHLHDALTKVCQSHRAKTLDIDFFEPQEMQGSQQHGEALNRLIARTTSKHVVVVDPDIIITSPRWMYFCKRHIDGGCFIVGTPYGVPSGRLSRSYRHLISKKIMFHGCFPNVWCAMIDGEALRAAKLDMRPWDASETELDRGAWSWSRDTAWRLTDHGLRNNLKYIPLSVSGKLLHGLLRKRFSEATARMRRSINRAAVWSNRLGMLEFAFPGTDEVCCVHLGRHSRANRLIFCASAILDVCGAVLPAGESGEAFGLTLAGQKSRLKVRPRMTKQQRRNRRRNRRRGRC